jgi:DNA-binding winged helix-turn-helix (wHTH) protein
MGSSRAGAEVIRGRYWRDRVLPCKPQVKLRRKISAGPRKRVPWQGAQAIPLRPKAFAVLRLLLEHPGQLVTKQQVLDTVWPGTFVGDAVLKDCIRQIREALEDVAGSPGYIETSHRRCYRFIGKVSELSPGARRGRLSAPGAADMESTSFTVPPRDVSCFGGKPCVAFRSSPD